MREAVRARHRQSAGAGRSERRRGGAESLAQDEEVLASALKRSAAESVELASRGRVRKERPGRTRRRIGVA